MSVSTTRHSPSFPQAPEIHPEVPPPPYEETENRAHPLRVVHFRNHKLRTGEAEYAFGHGRVCDDSISLVLQVSTKPMAELSTFWAENPPEIIPNAKSKAMHTSLFHDLGEERHHVTRLLANVHIPFPPEKAIILSGLVTLFTTVFPHMKPTDSAVNIHYGMNTIRANQLLNPTKELTDQEITATSHKRKKRRNNHPS